MEPTILAHSSYLQTLTVNMQKIQGIISSLKSSCRDGETAQSLLRDSKYPSSQETSLKERVERGKLACSILNELDADFLDTLDRAVSPDAVLRALVGYEDFNVVKRQWGVKIVSQGKEQVQNVKSYSSACNIVFQMNESLGGEKTATLVWKLSIESDWSDEIPSEMCAEEELYRIFLDKVYRDLTEGQSLVEEINEYVDLTNSLYFLGKLEDCILQYENIDTVKRLLCEERENLTRRTDVRQVNVRELMDKYKSLLDAWLDDLPHFPQV